MASIKPRPYLPWLRYKGILENKTNLHIDSLKTAIEDEWNKTSEEFILKAIKSFRMRVGSIIEKQMVAI